MNAKNTSLSALLLPLLLALPACTKHSPEQAKRPETVVKYGIPVTGGPMDTLLLKDYAPASSLVVPRTHVPKAAFPVIDVHSHADMSNIKTPEDVTAWVSGPIQGSSGSGEHVSQLEVCR